LVWLNIKFIQSHLWELNWKEKKCLILPIRILKIDCEKRNMILTFNFRKSLSQDLKKKCRLIRIINVSYKLLVFFNSLWEHFFCDEPTISVGCWNSGWDKIFNVLLVYDNSSNIYTNFFLYTVQPVHLWINSKVSKQNSIYISVDLNSHK
jgi:hypothetical protein